MYTLFIDTHAQNAILALYKDNELYQIKVTDKVSQSEVIMPNLILLLEEAKITADDLSKIAVNIGPGSFTGVRLGVTIAKTMSYCKNIPLVTVTSLELGLPTNADYLFEEEKNGYYIGEVKDNEITDYIYLKKEDFKDFCLKHEVTRLENVNYEALIHIINKKESKNPHEVNPLYVKLIEVEKK